MTGLIRAEFRKLTTTQVWFWLLIVSLGITAIGVVGTMSSPNDELDVHSLFTSANAAYLGVFVLGILGVSTEFRYQTITPTVLATPSRWRIISAKLLSFAIVGVVYALLCLVLELAMALPWLSARDVHYSVSGNIGAMASAFAVVALYALVGIGAGALLRNQIVAVVVGVIFVLVLQNLILAIPGVKYAYPYLPSGAAAAITSSSDDRVVNHVTLFPVWGGIVVLALWGIGMAVLGAGITMNRDIT